VTGAAGIALALLILGVPLLGFTLWPLVRRAAGPRTFLAVPPDAREPLREQKRRVLRALRELDFEREAGHVAADDYADLRARYEAEAAAILTELDHLGAAAEGPSPQEAPTGAVSRRRVMTFAASATALVAFGVALGMGIVRHTAPDPAAGLPAPGSRPLATLDPPPAAPDAPAPTPGPVSPQMLQGMLQAARTSLFEGRYGEAMAAYRAVLARDPKNVDAMTHLGLIVAIGGHADTALETFERALAIDSRYPPALLYRGQVLYESKQDREGAIRSWEEFLKVIPAGEDHERVKRLIAEARARR